MNQNVTLDQSKAPQDLTDYQQNTSLSGDNKTTFMNRLWNRIFTSRLQFSRYEIIDQSNSHFTIKRYEDEENDFHGYPLNTREQKALEKISLQCKEEAQIIKEEILSYLQASKKVVDVNHPLATGGGDYKNTRDSSSSPDKCGINF